MNNYEEPCVSDFDTLNNDYEIARKNAREWKFSVYSEYTKSEQYLIMGMLAYLENIERGFEKYNNPFLT